MRFRTGKYKGMTVDHVKKIAPWYIQWIRENRPEMLRDRPAKKPRPAAPLIIEPTADKPVSAMQPNNDFDSE